MADSSKRVYNENWQRLNIKPIERGNFFSVSIFPLSKVDRKSMSYRGKTRRLGLDSKRGRNLE